MVLAAAARPPGSGGRRRRVATACALMLAGALLAGCNALLNAGSTGPNAAIVGRDLSAGPEEHARIVAAYGGIYHNDKLEQTVARIVGADRGRIGRSRTSPTGSPSSMRRRSTPSPCRAAISTSPAGCWRWPTISSEVAAVLAHEMAHVTANHAIERQNKARNAVIVSRVVTDVLDGDSSGQLALASSQRSLASFSRQQELEADAMGVKTIGKAGYDPFAAARFLATMGQFANYRIAAGPTLEKAPDFLASHPSTPERVEFATRAARQFGAPGVGEPGSRPVSRRHRRRRLRRRSEPGLRPRPHLHPPDARRRLLGARRLRHRQYQRCRAGHRRRRHGAALRCRRAGQGRRSRPVPRLGLGERARTKRAIKRFSVNGMPAASASASAKGWEFRIAIIQAESGATYRFIFANEEATKGLEGAAALTVSSFRMLDQRGSGNAPAAQHQDRHGAAGRHGRHAGRRRCAASIGRANCSASSTISTRARRSRAGTQFKIVAD